MSILSQKHFHDEAAAFAFVEGIIWNGAPVCPHCGGLDRVYDLTKTRIGLKKCGHCRKQFTVRVGTIFEDSHLPMTKWLQAIHLMCASKKGVSSHQLMRILQTTYRTAWFLSHRIREAMRSGDLAPFGGNGGAVEVDETFIGHDKAIKPKGDHKRRGYEHKYKVLALVDRTTGRARSMVVDSLRAEHLTPILQENIARESRVMTDEAHHYRRLRESFAEHGFVRHSADQYVHSGDRTIHTNTIEGYFSVFKRGIKGVYQHCSKKHLHRYLAEFDFRYSNRVAMGVSDSARAARALVGAKGKRLYYRQPA